MNAVLIEIIYSLSLYILGALLYFVMKLSGIKKEFPDKTLKEALAIYLKRYWDVLLKQVVIAALLVVSVIIWESALKYKLNGSVGVYTKEQVDSWGKYVLAIALGIGGTRIVYKRLEKVVKKLEGDEIETEKDKDDEGKIDTQ